MNKTFQIRLALRRSGNLKSKIKNLKWVGIVAISVMLAAFGAGAQTHQPGKIYRIGFLSGGFPGPLHWTTRLRKELRKLGYVEDKNIIIESRFTKNRRDRGPVLADALVRLKVDVIVAGGRNDALNARNASRTVPIVGVNLLDPVGAGLVNSLARPGGNVTGFTTIADVLAGKRLELLKETVSHLSRVAVLWVPHLRGSVLQWKGFELAARELGLQLHSMALSSADKFETAFNEAIKAHSTGLVTTANSFTGAHRKRIADLAAKNRLPAIYDRAEFVANGGLMSYGADEFERFRRVAVLVDKVLKGAKPADLPLEQPTKFEMIINLNAAKQIGLKIPPDVLARADKVIK